MAKKKKTEGGPRKPDGAGAPGVETPAAAPSAPARTPPAAGPPDAPARRWPLQVVLMLMLLGIGIGAYMAWHHEMIIYGAQDVELVGCTETANISCDEVNTSQYSEFLGIPIGLLAIPTYLAIAWLALTALRRHQRQPVAYGFAIAVATVLYSAFLFYISKTQVKYLCLYCMSLYGINFATAVLLGVSSGVSPGALFGRAFRDLAKWPPVMRTAAVVFVVALLATVGIQKVYRAQLTGPTVAALDKTGGGSTSPADGSDPRGTLPARSWTVQTEDGNQKPLTLDPDDAWTGNPDAAVTVVEFADLECGYCKRLSSDLHRIHDAYGDRILFVFKHFPMDPACNPGVRNRRHASACAAARASVCARKQGRFWAFHDLAFKNQHKLDAEALLAYAEKAGAERGAFEACLRDPASADKVRKDATAGAGLDIHGTPRIYINGKLYKGPRTAEAIARTIEIELGSDPQAAQAAVAGLRERGPDVAAIPADVPAEREIRYGDLHFAIDTFEASIEEGKAVSGQTKVPAVGVSWFTAKTACEAAGRRMCTEQEWLAACQGAQPRDDDADGSFADDMIEGTAYPYSDFHTPGTCWDGQSDNDAARPVYTGSFPGCRSKDGVYDLTGNMEEWVGDSEPRAMLLGGAFDTKEDKARCYRNNDTFGPGFSAPRNGFRCCRSLP